MLNKEQKSDKKMSDKKKKILLASGFIVTTVTVAGLTGYIVYKKCNNKPIDTEAEMLRDVVLEAGVFDAAISNLSRKIDNKRCKLANYLAGGNYDMNKVKQLQDDILKLEQTLAYAVNKKEHMIGD